MISRTTLFLLLLFPLFSQALSLPLKVTQVERGVQLSWTIPTERENGDLMPVTELGGYELAYGCNNATDIQVINDPAIEVFVFTGLSGNCEFAIAAFDTDGLYSEWSDAVSANITPKRGPKKMTLNALLKLLFGVR